MTTIAGMLGRVKGLGLKAQVPVIIETTQAELILLNQLQLFQHGEDILGNKNAPYKNTSYAKFKEAKNPQPGYGVPDLKLTGEFYQGFYVEADQNVFRVGSKDSKSADLEAKYGKEIFGLTKDNMKVYALGVFYKGVQKYVTLKTGLRFA